MAEGLDPLGQARSVNSLLAGKPPPYSSRSLSISLSLRPKPFTERQSAPPPRPPLQTPGHDARVANQNASTLVSTLRLTTQVLECP